MIPKPLTEYYVLLTSNLRKASAWEGVVGSEQKELERYLLNNGIVNRRELELAKKVQRAQQGPLPILLWQLSFITLVQLGALLDWSGQLS
ncbi:gsr3381 [Gloeobacter violaceus PCC 7421]|uniref:Gsr3381 protein n=1 Tax=Gloeobacter violaceus (strain ATCC 29082 / PCC 7421) TaxID=251221 RepID=Q7NFZ3_GLOVI|nr:gsr3381 [Gloeobacter violaceus PCC 7421]